MHAVFWQNILSPHQAPFLRSLAEMGHDIVVVTAESMAADRRDLGWDVPNLSSARVVVGPDAAETKRLIDSSPKDAIHIMAGARLVRLGHEAVRSCLASGRRLGIMSEAPDPRGVSGCGRWAKYTAERYFRGFHYNFVLAMGEMGGRWFRRCGYPAQNVFPFTYVTEQTSPLKPNESPNGISLLYVGQFIVRKGLDVLLRAFAAVPTKRAELRLLGDGPEKERLQGLAYNLGIQNRVTWLPKRNAIGVQMEMEKADVTLLPSRHDGWGAVVNESLMAGTPVLCSNACGAADLIRQPSLGTIFNSESIEELTRALTTWIDLGPRSQSERDRIRRWAICINGEAIAKYFVAIVDRVYSNSPHPLAPWRMNS